MVSNVILNILQEFDQIIELLSKDKDAKKGLEKFNIEINLLKLWRDEVESEKQSIIVLGKTSTGKSEFHNLIIDVDDSLKPVFKTSTDVQTSVIQTLKHCLKKEDAFAEIEIKNEEEFLKLKLPDNLGITKKENTIRIPLTKTDQISFLRDRVMARGKQSFNVSEAINQINIHFPLKYFKEFVFIDTPGFGANDSEVTDIIVEKIIYGKSHLIWLLDAEEITLNNSFSLLKEKKELLKANFNKINFIGNRFDNVDLEEFEVPNNTHEAIKIGLNKTFNKGLVEILGIPEINKDLIFTSFKVPTEKFPISDTFDELKKLEEKFQLEKKEVNLNNIESFVDTLKIVLTHLKDEIVAVKSKAIVINKEKITSEILSSRKNISEIVKVRELADDRIVRSKTEISNLMVFKRINNHEKYNVQIEKLKKELNAIHNKLGNLIKAKLKQLIAKDDNLKNKIRDLKYADELILKEKETIIKKRFYDKELNSKKEIIIPFLHKKNEDLDDINESICDIIDDSIAQKGKEIKFKNALLQNLNAESENIEANLQSIGKIKAKIKNIHNLLIQDTETKIAEWSSVDSKNGAINVLENFLELNYLLDDHNILINRYNGK
ncbi:MAG: hypothetical protein ACQEWG_06140 [Bacteroidota bacterium]